MKKHSARISRVLGGMIVFTLFCLLRATAQTEGTAMIEDLLKEAKEKLAPDRRTTVFNVQGETGSEGFVVKGEVQSRAMKEALLAFLKERGVVPQADNLVALPQPALGEKTLGVVSVSVANIRTHPDHSAEMGTQALLGTPLRILKKEHGWMFVQTPDEYLGWTDDEIVEMTPPSYEEWTARPKVIVTADYASVRESADGTGPQVSDVVAGCLLALKSETGDQYEVAFPDARTGSVRKADAAPWDAYLTKAKPTQESVVATAKRFMGVPYFWGGTSAKALDCSGFTKTVYFLNGVQLPRDASQQVYVGDSLDTSSEIDLQPGDLLFFGARAKDGRKERVTHTAISLGGKRFIHSSGRVRCNSLDPGDPDFSEYRLHSFLRARRIIGAQESSGIRFLTSIPYYAGKP